MQYFFSFIDSYLSVKDKASSSQDVSLDTAKQIHLHAKCFPLLRHSATVCCLIRTVSETGWWKQRGVFDQTETLIFKRHSQIKPRENVFDWVSDIYSADFAEQCGQPTPGCLHTLRRLYVFVLYLNSCHINICSPSACLLAEMLRCGSAATEAQGTRRERVHTWIKINLFQQKHRSWNNGKFNGWLKTEWERASEWVGFKRISSRSEPLDVNCWKCSRSSLRYQRLHRRWCIGHNTVAL